ncbi:MAG: glycosyltransferase, partial [Chitinophagaceae bacterium]
FKYLIDAMLHLEKSHGGRYHVACFGAGAFIREEREAIAAKGLSHRFYFHDFVPDTAPYMKACDLIVMPSLWEACPLQPMEVLSAGVPFVASDCLGLREVCEHTPAVMISAGNTQALIDGILAIEQKPKKVFEEFSPIAKERYDIQKTFIAIKQLYADILAK